MATAPLGNVLHHLNQLVVAENARGLTDGQLLEHFSRRQDPAAFAALMQRHGRLVLGVCRHVLGHEQDAEDAFQATFLVLARHAAAVRNRNALAGWLHGVAYRTAMKAKRAAARRRAHEKQAPPPRPPAPSEASCRELQAALDEEVQQLPEKYRAPFVLCCLEGKGTAEAASHLGWKAGTVSGRLSRARKLLLERLARRGITLSAALAVTSLAAESATAAMPDALADATLGAVLGGPGALASIRPAVAALVRGMSRSLFVARVKIIAGMLLAGCLLAAGAVGLARQVGAPAPADPGAPAQIKVEPARLDRHGDSLPPDAVTRLGTVRFLHGWGIGQVVYSPDGKLVVTSAVRHRVWDAATGRELPNRGIGPKDLIVPLGDKLLAASRDRQGTVLRDLATGKEVRRLPVGDLVAVSADGKAGVVQATEERDGKDAPLLRVHDLESGRLRKTIRLESPWHPSSGPVILSADASTVIVPNMDQRTFQVWDVATGTQRTGFGIEEPQPRNWERPLTWAVSADGYTLATVGGKLAHQAYLWDTRTGKALPPLPDPPAPGSGTQVRAVVLSRDGSRLATACFDRTLRVWDLAARKVVAQIKGVDTRGYGRWASAAAFSPDGTRLALDDGNRLCIWDLATGKPCHDLPDQAVSPPVAFSPDGKSLLGESDGVIRLWDPLTGREKARVQQAARRPHFLALSPDGKWVAASDGIETVRLLELGTGREVWRVDAKPWAVGGLCFLPDSRTLAAAGASHEKVIHLLDVASGREVRRIVTGCEVMRMALFPDGSTIAAQVRTNGRIEPGIRLWDVASGKDVKQRRPYPGGICALAVSPDSKLVALARESQYEGNDGSISLWDPAEGREVRRFPSRVGHRGSVLEGQSVSALALAFSPDGRVVAAGYNDGTVRLWEIASGKERAAFEGHRGPALRVVFSPDGSLLASGAADQLVLVWDVTGRATSGQRADAAPSGKELESLWSDLGSLDAARANRALKGLLVAGRHAVPFLKERLRPVPAADPARLDRLLADLDNKRFAVRQKAADELRKLGEQAEPSLRKLLAGRPSLEVRRQIEILLAHLDRADSADPEHLRTLRALEALEHIGTPEAREVLGTVASGAANVRRTREAKASLDRLARR